MKAAKLAKLLVGLGLSVMLFSPSFISNVTLEEAVRLGHFPTSASFRSDKELMLWLNENVASNEVILNECTFTSFFLRGFSMKNVTCGINLSQGMILSLQQLVRPFWDQPSENLFIKIMQVYHVRYVFQDSEREFWTLYSAWKPGVGQYAPYEYRNKPHDVSYYRSFFLELPYVKLVLTKGDGTVYRVDY